MSEDPTQTTEVRAEGGRRKEVRIDVEDLPPDVEVVIRRTGRQVQEAAGAAIASAPSYDESRRTSGAPLEQPARKEQAEPVSAQKPTVSEKSGGEQRSERVPNRDWPTAKRIAAGARNRWRRLDNVRYGGAIKAGLAASSVGLLPGLYYGSGLSTLGAGAAAVSLGAVALPAIGLYEGIKQKKPVQGLLIGSGSGALLAAMGGASASSLATAFGTLALPAGLAYAGYKIGKQNGRPTIGMLAGGTAGLLAAPLTTGAITAASGGGWAALGGAALGLGSTAVWAGGIGLAGAGLYGLGRLNRKLNVPGLSTNKGGFLGTMAQSLALPISAIAKGVTWVGSKIPKRGNGPAPEAQDAGTPNPPDQTA